MCIQFSIASVLCQFLKYFLAGFFEPNKNFFVYYLNERKAALRNKSLAPNEISSIWIFFLVFRLKKNFA